MQYLPLGHSDLTVSRLCLGTMAFGDPAWQPWILREETSRSVIRRAIELGVTFFDTADMYSNGSSEEILGRAIASFARRDELVIATKVYFPTGPGPDQRGLSRAHIREAIDGSLRRLGLDYVDLYQIHRWDYGTPLEETLDALREVVTSGKARYLGASSMHAWQFASLRRMAASQGCPPFVSMQNHYNLAYREEEREMLPLCRAAGVAVIPWSPLARGFLARPMLRQTVRAQSDADAHRMYGQPADWAVRLRLEGIATSRRAAPSQVALAWLLAQPGVTAPVLGATATRHVEEAVASLELRLTPDERRLLEEPYVRHPVMGHR